MQKGDFGAQGTIEYLVIIAIVVVIGLVVVGLTTSQMDAGVNISATSSEIRSKIGSGGISIADAAGGADGSGLLVLKNTGAETLTVEKISVDGVDHNYSDPIVAGSQTGFRLQDIVSCDGASKSYSIMIYYASASGLDKTADFQTITVDCAPTVVPSGNFVDENIFTGPFGGGDGSAGDPYRVSSWSQLSHVMDYPSASFILTADLDPGSASYAGIGDNWTPLGNDVTQFFGDFNGNGHTISGLRVNQPSRSWVGFFGYTNGADISNIKLVDANIFGGGMQVGSLVGFQIGGTVTNSTATGAVKGASYRVGGLVGEVFLSGSVTRCGFDGNVRSAGNSYVGGLVGTIEGTISDSYSDGNVIGGDRVGGLVGLQGAGSITDSYSLADVTSSDGLTGGLAGATVGSVSRCFSAGKVTSPGSYTGGMIGRVYSGSVLNSFWDTEASGKGSSAGGTGLTTSLMHAITPFASAGWTIAIGFGSDTHENRPYLGWQTGGGASTWYTYLPPDG